MINNRNSPILQINEYQKKSIEYYNNEKYVECITILNKVLELNQNDIIALCNRATCNYKLELYKHCIKDCDLALTNDENNKIALLRKSMALQQLSTFSTSNNYENEINSLKSIACNSWGYVSIKLDDQEEEISTQPIVVEEEKVEKEEEEFEIIITPQQQMLIYQEKQQIYLQEQQEMIDDLLSSPPPQREEDNGCHENNDEVAIHKSESMEELNKLLEQLSTESISNLIQDGNVNVNSGNYKEAIEIFTMVIDGNPLIPSAYLGRGTSNAFLGQLDEAIYDFSKAIELDNTSSDAYKRRGQSKVAKSMEYEALEDFNQSVAFDRESDYDIYYNRGLLHYQMRNYERALKDFRKVVSIEPLHKLAWNRIGLCLNVNGYPMDAYIAFMESIKIDSNFEASWTNIGQCWKDIGKYQQSYAAFSKALEICPNYSNALHLRGILFFNSGQHLNAIKDWNSFLQTQQIIQKQQGNGGGGESSDTSSIIEVLSLRGIVNQSIGSFKKACLDFDSILESNPLSNLFYQKEITLFTNHNINKPTNTFNFDRSLNCYLKTFQCQRLPHSSLPSSFKKQDSNYSKIQDMELTGVTITNDELYLFKEGKRIGQLLQYDCDGFLPNSRQKLQCGLAVLEIAQTLKLNLWNSNSTKYTLDGKSSSSTNRPHKFGWRDLYDIGVKWRQISEPNDPVWWGDLLSPEQFAEGFGSHTPLITGQCKVVRYYPMFEKSFEIMKMLLPIQHIPTDSNFLESIEKSTNCKQLYNVMKKDFFVVTPCYSSTNENKVMEGTRLTLQFVNPEGYEFAIRTPSTPQRWKLYDEELDCIWNQLIEKVKIYKKHQQGSNNNSGNNTSITLLLDEISDLILSMTFYWYNFMPLSRGSAAIGFTVLLGLFLSLDIEIKSPIPKGQQPDWEAILRPTTTSFINVIKPWLYPSRSNTNCQITNLVSSKFNTFKKMIQILNNSNN